MEHMDDVASWIRPDEFEPALRLVALLESCGSMSADEAAEWRRRIVEWASYKAVGGEAAPNALTFGNILPRHCHARRHQRERNVFSVFNEDMRRNLTDRSRESSPMHG